jgi:hypothetical protein
MDSQRFVLLSMQVVLCCVLCLLGNGNHKYMLLPSSHLNVPTP